LSAGCRCLPANSAIDHTVYDHSSLLATLEEGFNLEPLTDRDRNANSFNHLFSLGLPRKDAPSTLSPPADSGLICAIDLDQGILAQLAFGTGLIPKKDLPLFLDSGSFPQMREATPDAPLSPLLNGFVYVAFLKQYRLASEDEKPALVAD
jgi:hypothetical protein